MNALLSAITTTEQVAALDARLSSHATRTLEIERRLAVDRDAIALLAARQGVVESNLRQSLSEWEARFKALEGHVNGMTAALGATSLLCVSLQQAAVQNEQRLATSHAETNRLLQRVSALLKDQVHHEEELLSAAAGGGSRY